MRVRILFLVVVLGTIACVISAKAAETSRSISVSIPSAVRASKPAPRVMAPGYPFLFLQVTADVDASQSAAGDAPTREDGESDPRPDASAAPVGVTTSPAVSPVQTTGGLEPCGGDLPPCYVKQRESGGSYSARNNESAGAACGAWQIIGSTWAGYAGYPDACSAPPAVQDAKARELWAGGAGCAHWSAC